MIAYKFAVANDITPNRCTILSLHETAAEAQAWADDDEQAGVFELTLSAELMVGDRAYHLDGTAWKGGT